LEKRDGTAKCTRNLIEFCEKSRY